MLATPMQLAHAVSAIASRGEIYKPRLVSAVRAAGSTTLAPRPIQPEPTLTAVTRDQWQVVVDGMELATGPGGTAAVATAGTPYKIAGKTGSAQVFYDRSGREISRKGSGRALARSRAVHLIRSRRRPETCGGRICRKRQARRQQPRRRLPARCSTPTCCRNKAPAADKIPALGRVL